MISSINNRPTLSPGTLFFAGKKNKSKTQSQPTPVLPVPPAVVQVLPQSPPSQLVEAPIAEITPALPEDNHLAQGSVHSASSEESPSEVDPVETTGLAVIDKAEISEDEYARQQALEEKALFEAIGRRFAVPGRALNSAENYAKSWSRTLIDKTKTMIHQTKHAVSKKTAATLRSWANSLAPEQD